MLEAERDLLGQYEPLNSRCLVYGRGCFRYVQIHMVVAETHGKSILEVRVASGVKIRVESPAAINRAPLLWDTVSGPLKFASGHRFCCFLTPTFLLACPCDMSGQR
jgi:hypothetical protein